MFIFFLKSNKSCITFPLFRPASSLVESEELESCLVIDEIGPQSSTSSETNSTKAGTSPLPDSDTIEIISAADLPSEGENKN